jgi:alanine dehydrogenase
VSRATEPFLRSADVRPGTHVNAVGAITPERRELAPDVLERCTLIAADSVPAAVRLARELQDVAPDRIVPLSAVVAGTVGRPVDADLTLFKAMGIGLADLALGDEVLRRALSAGRGRPFPQPERLDPRLTPHRLTGLERSAPHLHALDHTGSPRG